MVRAFVARWDRDWPEAFRSWVGLQLRTLSAHHGCLLLGLLAVNAVFLPYHSRYHDAILYEFQVANQETGGRFAGDLFFEFGSQDSYSLFSRAMVPLARAVGHPVAFWLFYLGANALFYFGLIRLVQAMVPDPIAATLGLIWLAVVQVPLGGLTIFHVNEPFTTPRLLANGLVLLGLDRLLAGKLPISAALLLAALAMHPLMGVGGVLIALVWAVLRYAPRPRFLIGTALAMGLIVVAVPALGVRAFGYMDPFWHREARLAGACLFGTEWEVIDWLRALTALGVAVAAWQTYQTVPAVRALLAVLVLVSVLGIVGTFAASELPYALLTQGQPFRLLWINQILAVPLAFALMRTWWAAGDRRHHAGAILLLAVPALGVDAPTGPAVLLPVGLAIALWLSSAKVHRTASRWLCGGLALGLVTWSFAQTLAGILDVSQLWGLLASLNDPRRLITNVPQLVDPLTRLLLATAVLTGLGAVIGHGRSCRFALGSLALGVQILALMISHPLIERERLQIHEGDLRFLRTYLDSHCQQPDRPPTVYWPTGRLELVWHDLGCCSYFAHLQVVGNVFRRETAVEARRRTALAGPFETDLTRSLSLTLPRNELRARIRLIGQGLDSAHPTTEDVRRLCADTRLDYAVLRQDVPGWYAIRHGGWFLYDCRALRERGALAHPDVALATTTRHQGERP